MAIFSIADKIPDVDGSAYVDETATVTANVTLAKDTSVWPGASLRGDEDAIFVGEGSNIQDCAVLHTDIGKPCRVGRGVTVGHNAVVHGCTVGNNVLIGMGAVIQDGASVGDNCIVGAGTLIPPRKAIPAGSVVFGSPYRLVRTASEADLAAVRANAAAYLRLAEEYAEENAAENL